MAYETAAVAILIIVILVAIIVIVLMIYYSCYVYYDNNEDDTENDNTNSQDNIYNRRILRKNNNKTTLNNIQTPLVTKKNLKKDKIDIIDTSIEDEINRLVNSNISNQLNEDNFLRNQQIITVNKNNNKYNNSDEIDVMHCEENFKKVNILDDINIRGKSVYEFINKKRFPNIIKINRNQQLDNDIENNTLIKFDENNYYQVDLPNDTEGLSLNFWNGSMTSQSICSNKPILSKDTVSLIKILHPSTFISLICSGSTWIITNIIGDEIINISPFKNNENKITTQNNIVNETDDITRTPITKVRGTLFQNDNNGINQSNFSLNINQQISNSMLRTNTQLNIADSVSSIEDDLKRLLESSNF